MRWLLMLVMVVAAGCGPYTRAQMDLVTQARRGVANVQKRAEGRAADARELAALKRQRLDEAFDADVRAQEAMDAEWVIDHRKAYEAGLEAYARQQAAADDALAGEKRDLGAIDAALARLYWLQSVQVKFDLLEEVLNGDH